MNNIEVDNFYSATAIELFTYNVNVKDSGILKINNIYISIYIYINKLKTINYISF